MARLKTLRLERGMTQVELSVLTGLSQVHIAKLEAGHIARPRPETARVLAEAFGVTPQSLFPAMRKSAAA